MSVIDNPGNKKRRLALAIAANMADALESIAQNACGDGSILYNPEELD
jgi:hypothetical protein